jgi:hypothetical protein
MKYSMILLIQKYKAKLRFYLIIKINIKHFFQGGSVIRMANYFIGSDTFYRGITVNISDQVFMNGFILNIQRILEISK